MLQLFSSDREPTPAPLDPDALDRARARGEVQLDTLTRLAEIGLEMAAETGRRAHDLPLDADMGGCAMAYSRIARAVRMTIALQSRVMKELLDLEQVRANARERAAEAQAAADKAPLEARRRRIELAVGRVIRAEHDDDETEVRLGDDAWELLCDEDLCGDILTRPMGEVVELICRELGLSPDWGRLAEEAWAVEEGFSPQRPPGNAEIAELPSLTAAPTALPCDLSG